MQCKVVFFYSQNKILNILIQTSRVQTFFPVQKPHEMTNRDDILIAPNWPSMKKLDTLYSLGGTLLAQTLVHETLRYLIMRHRHFKTTWVKGYSSPLFSNKDHGNRAAEKFLAGTPSFIHFSTVHVQALCKTWIEFVHLNSPFGNRYTFFKKQTSWTLKVRLSKNLCHSPRHIKEDPDLLTHCLYAGSCERNKEIYEFVLFLTAH